MVRNWFCKTICVACKMYLAVFCSVATKRQRIIFIHVNPCLFEGFPSLTTAVMERHYKNICSISGPKGRRFKSCHLDQKSFENSPFSKDFLCNMHKFPFSRAFPCNYSATFPNVPKSRSTIYCVFCRIYILDIAFYMDYRWHYICYWVIL